MFVASTQSGSTTRSSSRSTSLLDGHLLEDRLEHEVAVGEARPSRRAGRDRARGSAPCRRVAAAAAISARDRSARARSTISCVEVAEDDRHLEPAEEQRRELRRHQARADDADLPHRRGSAPSSGGPLRPPLDEAEGVDRRLRLPRRAAARRSPPPLSGSPPRASRWPRPRSGRARRTAREPRRGRRRRRRSRARRMISRARTSRARLARARRPTSSSANAIDSSTSSTGSSSRSARPSSSAFARRAGGSGAAGSRRSAGPPPRGPISRGVSCVPPQRGEDAEEDLGQAEMADVRRDRAGVAVERELDAAAEAGAVDRRDRRERQRARSARTARGRRGCPSRASLGVIAPGTRRCRRRRRTRTACR